jgi:anthraniloyl-CoA monooxygenase
MKVVCIGGGPSGLCLAILMKLKDPHHEVEVYERHAKGNTFGWGVVLSQQITDQLSNEDRDLTHMLLDHCAEWDEVELRVRGRVFTSSGHGYIGIGRKQLLEVFADRATSLGVKIFYNAEIDSIERFADADLIVASDGIHSDIRQSHSTHFKPDLDIRKNKFIWFGTTQSFPAFTFAFEETEHGWFQAHAYQFEDGMSTFIIECPEDTYHAHALHEASTEESISFCETLFSKHLDGHALQSNAKHIRGSEWLNFCRVQNEIWHHDRIVLIGDAAHTAHFSIGSGTRLGVGDAIDLTECLHNTPDLTSALSRYEELRRVEVLKIQSAARNSTEWFENVARYVDLPDEQFFYSMLTRSQRIGHANLKERDPTWVKSYERWFSERCGQVEESPPPPMFTPYRLRSLNLSNRVVVSPMCTYSSSEGSPTSFHLVHLGARALGGVGLIITEMTAILANGRITPQCAGLYSDQQEEAWRAITDFVHTRSSAKIALQLGHAGPRASTCPPHLGLNLPLDKNGWPTIAASSTQVWPGCPTPRALSESEMSSILEAYKRSAIRADRAEFDMLELHAAHGYLLASFLSPLLNKREDQFGGTLRDRLRFPLQVFEGIRSVWPATKPISVRLSATDWAVGGLDVDEAVEIARAFQERGADIINVSSGQTTPDEQPIYGRMYQTPLSDQIRNEAKVPTMAVGNIYLPDHVNTIIASGRADLCCLGRPHLFDPNWTLRAAAEQGYPQPWPRQYEAGKDQLSRLIDRQERLVIRV